MLDDIMSMQNIIDRDFRGEFCVWDVTEDISCRIPYLKKTGEEYHSLIIGLEITDHVKAKRIVM